MNKILIGLLLTIAVASAILLGHVSAQTLTALPQAALAQKYGITFPISELGGCTDLTTCRAYCDDPQNQTVCVSFAQSKGLALPSASVSAQLLADAKIFLGCDSEASCKAFCQDSSHENACKTFAQSHNLHIGQATTSAQILTAAKTVLGCTSIDSCKVFCAQDANKKVCSDFARTYGIRGGEQSRGPGGCTSEETCKAFCTNPTNFQTCQAFVASSGAKLTFHGPGGCTSEETCQMVCQKYPSLCAGFHRELVAPCTGSTCPSLPPRKLSPPPWHPGPPVGTGGQPTGSGSGQSNPSGIPGAVRGAATMDIFQQIVHFFFH